MSIDISSVKTFGGIDADTDELLAKVFDDHIAYHEAINHEKTVIVGRKGTGKTAIFKKILQNNAENRFAIGHVFTDYPWHHHQKQRDVGVPEEQCYVQSWTYLVYVTLARLLLNIDQSQPWSDEALLEVSKLEQFIVDTYGTRDPAPTQVFSPATKISLTGEIGFNWKILSGRVGAQSITLDYLPVVVQDVNQTLSKSIISSLNPACSYFISFDEIDLGFDPKTDYSARLIGLLIASRRINNIARSAGKRLSIVVFLRDDIYSLIKFEDKNKITESTLSTIEWDAPGSEFTLKRLMQKRFNYVLDIPEEDSWQEVFDETEEMSHRQKKYAHICDRTFLRPRDIIKFCNSVLDHYKRRGPYPGEKFSNVDINSAREDYSVYLLNELEDEIRKHLPNYDQYLEVFKEIGELGFERSAFDAAFAKHKGGFPDGFNEIRILQDMFEFGVVAFLKSGGGGGGSDYVWRHKDRRTKFNDGAQFFRIHAGLKEALGVKKFSRS